MVRQVLVPAALLAGGYAALCALAFATQRGQIYFPVRESAHPGAQSIRIDTGGVVLKVWTEPRPGSRALVYFGGNAEDVALNLPAFRAAFSDRSLYLVNYRGYGGSGGHPAEAGILADALAVFDHVHARHAEVSVIGRSLGSAVAMHVASRRPVERLALVTPFDSLVEVARAHMPWLPVGLLMLDRYEAARRADAIRAPVLVVIAGEDEIIPRARSDALVAALAHASPRVVELARAGHNDLDLDPQYADVLAKFLAS